MFRVLSGCLVGVFLFMSALTSGASGETPKSVADRINEIRKDGRFGEETRKVLEKIVSGSPRPKLRRSIRDENELPHVAFDSPLQEPQHQQHHFGGKEHEKRLESLESVNDLLGNDRHDNPAEELDESGAVAPQTHISLEHSDNRNENNNVQIDDEPRKTPDHLAQTRQQLPETNNRMSENGNSEDRLHEGAHVDHEEEGGDEETTKHAFTNKPFSPSDEVETGETSTKCANISLRRGALSSVALAVLEEVRDVLREPIGVNLFHQGVAMVLQQARSDRREAAAIAARHNIQYQQQQPRHDRLHGDLQDDAMTPAPQPMHPFFLDQHNSPRNPFDLGQLAQWEQVLMRHQDREVGRLARAAEQVAARLVDNASCFVRENPAQVESAADRVEMVLRVLCAKLLV